MLILPRNPNCCSAQKTHLIEIPAAVVVGGSQNALSHVCAARRFSSKHEHCSTTCLAPHFAKCSSGFRIPCLMCGRNLQQEERRKKRRTLLEFPIGKQIFVCVSAAGPEIVGPCSPRFTFNFPPDHHPASTTEFAEARRPTQPTCRCTDRLHTHT